VADGNALFCEKILYIAMSQIESIAEPDCIGNDVSWGANPESVTYLVVHPWIASQGELSWQYPPVALNPARLFAAKRARPGR